MDSDYETERFSSVPPDMCPCYLSCIRNKSIDISNPLAHRAHIKTSSVDVDKRAWWNGHNPSNGD